MTIRGLVRTDRTTADVSLGQLHDTAGQVDEELLPCRVNNPELWSPNRPPTWSAPRSSAWTARSVPCASMVRSNATSPGVSGEASSSSKAW